MGIIDAKGSLFDTDDFGELLEKYVRTGAFKNQTKVYPNCTHNLHGDEAFIRSQLNVDPGYLCCCSELDKLFIVWDQVVDPESLSGFPSDLAGLCDSNYEKYKKTHRIGGYKFLFVTFEDPLILWTAGPVLTGNRMFLDASLTDDDLGPNMVLDRDGKPGAVPSFDDQDHAVILYGPFANYKDFWGKDHYDNV